MAIVKVKVGDLERDLKAERRRAEEVQLQLHESVGSKAELLAAREELLQMRQQCREAEDKTTRVEIESEAQLMGELHRFLCMYIPCVNENSHFATHV